MTKTSYEVQPLDIVPGASEFCRAVEVFRGYYDEVEAQEIDRVPLISAHDPSIMFTNSTTSVMKPWLRGEQIIPEEGIYLTQPAMGSQGLRHWQDSATLGPYASYFTSMGSLYLPSLWGRAADDMAELAYNRWELPPKAIHLAVYEGDEDLIDIAYTYHIPTVLGTNEQDFRHVYGMDNIQGRNLNLQTRIGEQVVGLGNLTKIYDTVTGDPIAWEVSFDSAPVLNARNNTGHAVAASIAAAVLYSTGEWQLDDSYLAAADTASVSTALMLEGMEPQSRGKAGKLRQFLREYLDLTSAQGVSLQVAQESLARIAGLETAVRHSLSPEPSQSINPATARGTIEKWTPQLWKPHE